MGIAILIGSIALLAAATAPVTAEEPKGDPPPEVVAYLARCDAAMPEKIEAEGKRLEELERALRYMRRGRITGTDSVNGDQTKHTFSSKESKQKVVTDQEALVEVAESRLKGMRSGEERAWLPMPSESPVLGMIGAMDGKWVRIIQALGPTEALVEVAWRIERVVVSGQASGGFSASAIQTPTYRREAIKEQLLLRGVPTAGVADDSQIDLTGVFQITDTYRYETVMGAAATVFVLEPPDLSPWDKPVVQAAEESAEREPEFRILTDNTGEHTNVARFRGMVGNVVRLERNGKTIEVDFDRLSEADQEWVRQQAK